MEIVQFFLYKIYIYIVKPLIKGHNKKIQEVRIQL